MDYVFVKSADAIALKGAIAIVLGVIALLLPGPTFLALTVAFGTFAMIDGLLALIAMFDRSTRLNRGWLALEAVAGIVAGVITLVWPGITAAGLIYLISAWAMVTGVIKIVNAVRLRKQIRREWLLILSGVASILLGGILAVMPLPGIVALMWAVGAYGLVFGGLLVVLAIRLRRFDEARREERPRAA